MFNHANINFKIQKGDRIAQLILEKYVSNTMIVETNNLDESQRGQAGFGSTGIGITQNHNTNNELKK